jgi:hypothetical protein
MPSSREAAAAGADLITAALRPRATVIGAFVEGWRRVLAAPALSAGVLLLTIAMGLPLAFALDKAIAADLGSSLDADRLLYGWDEQWAARFSRDHDGIAQTFTHEILGFGGTLALISRFMDGVAPHPLVAGVAAAYVAAWLFLSGGLLDRFARGRPVGSAAFFAACGAHFLRFIRLAAIVAPCYAVLFRWVHPWLFATVYDRLTRNLTAEHQVLMIRIGAYALFLALLASVNLVADIAKVRTVVEDRRGMIAAVGAALRFVRRRPWRMAGVYLINILAAVVLARLWLQSAPEAWVPTWRAFLVGQLYILGRIWAKLAFMASEVAFFQGELAHRPYAAMPDPIWPDSPAVEAMANLRRR